MVDIDPDGEDHGTQLNRVRLDSASFLLLRAEPLPKVKYLVHKVPVKDAAIKTNRRRIDPERISIARAALRVARAIGLDEKVQSRPDNGHLGPRKAQADLCGDLAHIPLKLRHLKTTRSNSIHRHKQGR